MVDLSTNCAGIRSPNPFWLASGPPSNTGDQVSRAFDAGWGGAVWKTIGVPIQNVTSRYGSIDYGGKRVVGFNNIELISDRSIDVNLKEIKDVKRRFPNHAVVSSLMVETKEEWKSLIERCEEVGVDGHELNFGCPHGMCERGMGSAVGQEPEVLAEITSWAKAYAKKPVLVKLTPNIGDIVEPGRAAVKGGADGLSLINTIKSLMGVDLDKMVPLPVVGTRSTNGGYCGPAVKPIALHMVAALARDPVARKLPISGIGGVSNWRDAAEFIALGSSSVQVCTAVMHYGFRIVEDMIEGLSTYMEEKGFKRLDDLVGRAVPAFVEWGELDLHYKIIASIDRDKCIGCELCYIACWDGAHQCIEKGKLGPAVIENGHALPQVKVPRILEDHCTGCNLCSLVCPVDGCITMKRVDDGKNPVTWNELVAKTQLIKAH
ncbi:NAD-dependent dihydropyrimidine dehydrogenase subunit PreA [bacterium]|nr:NAD-dependent dihydropyrimidine dehydrogenase subunit PreA [bacterium]